MPTFQYSLCYPLTLRRAHIASHPNAPTNRHSTNSKTTNREKKAPTTLNQTIQDCQLPFPFPLSSFLLSLPTPFLKHRARKEERKKALCRRHQALQCSKSLGDNFLKQANAAVPRSLKAKRSYIKARLSRPENGKQRSTNQQKQRTARINKKSRRMQRTDHHSEVQPNPSQAPKHRKKRSSSFNRSNPSQDEPKSQRHQPENTQPAQKSGTAANNAKKNTPQAKHPSIK